MALVLDQVESTAQAQVTTPSWSYTGSLNAARVYHTATLLSNGKVLVAGGISGDGITLNNAELYDPASGTWSITGSLNVPRVYHSATLLQNGKVLVAGGYTNLSNPLSVFESNTAELYDPATGAWSYNGNLNTSWGEHTATLLQNGKVLFAGELFVVFLPTPRS